MSTGFLSIIKLRKSLLRKFWAATDWAEATISITPMTLAVSWTSNMFLSDKKVSWVTYLSRGDQAWMGNISKRWLSPHNKLIMFNDFSVRLVNLITKNFSLSGSRTPLSRGHHTMTGACTNRYTNREVINAMSLCHNDLESHLNYYIIIRYTNNSRNRDWSRNELQLRILVIFGLADGDSSPGHGIGGGHMKL